MASSSSLGTRLSCIAAAANEGAAVPVVLAVLCNARDARYAGERRRRNEGPLVREGLRVAEPSLFDAEIDDN